MGGRSRGKRATIDATIPATILKGFLCLLPLAPALRINLEAASGQGAAWTTFAIGSVLASAVFIEVSLTGRGFARSIVFGLLGAFFLCLNILNAIGLAATASDNFRDNRSTQIEHKNRIAALRSQLSQSRKSQFEIAGEETPAGIEAEIQAKQATDAKRWTATNGCEQGKITAGPSREFCAAIADLKRKKAAAEKRDEIDGKLAKLEDKDDSAPATVDPFAENVTRFITMFGYKVEDGDKIYVSASRDWGKGAGVELLAAFGPAALFLFLQREHRGPEKPARTSKARRQKKPDETGDGEASSSGETSGDKDGQIDNFFARRVENAAGEYIQPAVLYAAWKRDCEERGIKPGTQISFSKRMQRIVAYERNNGRPRYCHVRLKKGAPRLKIVSD